jgi:hypothetical protein
MVSSDGSSFNTFGSVIRFIYLFYLWPGLCARTEPLNVVEPLGGSSGYPPRPFLLGLLLLSYELELLCGMFSAGNGGSGGPPELPTQFILTLEPPPHPPPLEGSSPPAPTLLDRGVEADEETSSVFLFLTISHFPLFRLYIHSIPLGVCIKAPSLGYFGFPSGLLGLL